VLEGMTPSSVLSKIFKEGLFFGLLSTFKSIFWTIVIGVSCSCDMWGDSLGRELCWKWLFVRNFVPDSTDTAQYNLSLFTYKLNQSKILKGNKNGNQNISLAGS
jgi:hypothetical protein